MPYRVRVRNTEPPGRHTSWATYAKAAREAVAPPLSQSELARRLDVDRGTIWRWESGKQRPDAPDIVIRWAGAVAVDPAEALAAAGLAPHLPPPPETPPARDEEVEAIMAAPVTNAQKKRMLGLLAEMREQDRQRRLEFIRLLTRAEE